MKERVVGESSGDEEISTVIIAGCTLDDDAFTSFLDHRWLLWGDDSLYGNQRPRQRRGPE